MAIVNLIRHAEKSKESGDGLTEDGHHRAEYLARCMSRGDLNQVLPIGPPTMVMASHVRPGRSHRPRDTAKPLADALGLILDLSCDKEDDLCFEDRVQSYLQANETLAVVWQHELIPMLAHALGVPKYLEDYLLWPDECDNIVWPEPEEQRIGDSACYDLIWQVRVVRTARGEPWRAESVAQLRQGFPGDPKGSCFEALAPMTAEELAARPPKSDLVRLDASRLYSVVFA